MSKSNNIHEIIPEGPDSWCDTPEASDPILNNGGRPCTKYCGNPKCGTSTGMLGNEITHGYGELDNNGYWSHPCFVCSSYYRKTEGGDHWPFPATCKQVEQVGETPRLDDDDCELGEPEQDPNVRLDQLRDMKEKILETLMDEGTLYIDELHSLVVDEACQSGMFDQVMFDLVSWGKIMFVYPGPLVSIATRTRPTNPRRKS